MDLSPESRAILDRYALQTRADILFDLAQASEAIETDYDPAAWDPRMAAQELPDLKRRLRAVLSGLGLPSE